MEASNSESIGAIVPHLRLAEQLLSKSLGGGGHLEPTASLDGRTNVIRCRISTPVPNAPQTIIVKFARRNDGKPYDLNDRSDEGGVVPFLQDWIGVEFLDALHNESHLGPRFYGGSRESGFFLMEDLGGGQSLANLLLGEDPQAAEQGLISFASALGGMHANTIGHKDAYDAHCADVGIPSELIAAPTNDDARSSVEALRSWCATLGVPPLPGLEAEIEAAFASMQSPGGFLAYTHGDPCPDNNRITADGFRLFDFERGAFRHALHDGVYGSVPFPTCWCVNRLPPYLPDRMEAAYRKELITACPQASDNKVFYREAAAACAFWLLTTMKWTFEKTLEEDGQWGISSLRQRYLLRLQNFAEHTERWGCLPALGATAAKVKARLLTLWEGSVEPMPLYPAFRAAGSIRR